MKNCIVKTLDGTEKIVSLPCDENGIPDYPGYEYQTGRGGFTAEGKNENGVYVFVEYE